MSRKKKRARAQKKAIIVISSIFILSILGFVSAAISYSYSYVKHYNKLIYPGVKVEGIDLSGKNLEEGKKVLQDNFSNKVASKKITVKTNDKNYDLGFSEIKPDYNIDKAINEAIVYGKNMSLFKKYKLIKKSEEKVINLDFSYDKALLQKFVDNIEKAVNKNPQDAKINREGNGFKITPEVVGKKLNKDKLSEDIYANLEDGTRQDIIVTAVIQDIKPKIAKEALASIDSLIASFPTHYGTISSPQRANNIVVSTKSINGIVLMPGDVFSFNEIVGERTWDRGYQAAPVIIGNKVESGLGGGICQTSSTLYNAVLMANMKSVERVHHTLPSSYVPLGRDATVDWGNIDYKFKNTLTYPVYIQGITSGGNLTFNIYSNKSLAKRRYDISTDVYQKLDSTTKTVEDPKLPEGAKEVVQNQYTGYKVKVYRNIYENGALVNQELISNDFYRPVEGLIKVGPKKAVKQ